MSTLWRIWEAISGIPAGYYHDRKQLERIQRLVMREVERQNPATMGVGHPCPYAASFKDFLRRLEDTLNAHTRT